MSVDPQIQELARRVAERFAPEKIILFGSHARGQAAAEMERRLELGDWFLREVVEEGIVLYERPHA